MQRCGDDEHSRASPVLVSHSILVLGSETHLIPPRASRHKSTREYHEVAIKNSPGRHSVTLCPSRRPYRESAHDQRKNLPASPAGKQDPKELDESKGSFCFLLGSFRAAINSLAMDA
jgi:hypothetical protein